MLSKQLPAILWLWLFSSSTSADLVTPNINIARSVVKVIAKTKSGKQSLGSGVIIGTNIIATNCHVTRVARSAFLLKEGFRYNVLQQAALPELDVCILKTQPIPHPLVPLAKVSELKISDKITMIGYPFALGIRMRPGAIIDLHDYNQEKIIEIDAGFMQGASGGGVFNKSGELVGLMTFMGKGKERLHYYVIPASWLQLAVKEKFMPMLAFTDLSFWEKGDFEHLKNLKNPLFTQQKHK